MEQESDRPKVRVEAPNFEQYKLLMARRQSFTQLIWQLPVLAAGANGVLLSKAAEAGDSFSGVAVAVLALVVSISSFQLLARHRLNEKVDTQLIRLFENDHPDYARTVAEQGGNNALYEHVFKRRPNFFASLPSGNVWNAVLFLLCVLSAVALAHNLAGYLGYGQATQPSSRNGSLGTCLSDTLHQTVPDPSISHRLGLQV